MKTYANPMTEKVCNILRPLVGETMACAVIKTQAKKLGFEEEDLSSVQLPALAEELKKGLTIFLGTNMAADVANRIKKVQ